MVRPEITDAAGLKGRKIATPQLGNTQDVALRAWLKDQNLTSDVDGGGDVSIAPQANAEGLAAYASGQIDGAWVPEPWVSEYVKAGAKVLVDEATLWPEGKFVTTNVIVRTEFLDQHPDAVQAFLAGHIAALKAIKDDPTASAEAANASLKSLTGSSLAPDVLTSAWKNVTFTADPLPATLTASAEGAIAVGLLEADKVEKAGGLPGTLYDLSLLNRALAEAGEPAVATPWSWTVTSRSLVDEDLTDPVALRMQGISKTYHSGERTVRALVDVDLHVDQGEFVSVIGESGCGKSTLLSIVAGLDAPSTGAISRRAGGADVPGRHPAALADCAGQRRAGPEAAGSAAR